MTWPFASQLATVVAALVGAVFGSLGAVVLQDRLSQSHRADLQRQDLIREHLYGLQEGAEQLWYRVYNAGRQKERPNLNDYYEETTLYALARTLASTRILALKGHYPYVTRECAALGIFLREDRLGDVLVERGLRYYERLALAESLIEQDGLSLRIRSFTEYHQLIRKGDLPGKDLLAPAMELVRDLESETDPEMLKNLCALAAASSSCTGVPSSLDRSDTSEGCLPAK